MLVFTQFPVDPKDAAGAVGDSAASGANAEDVEAERESHLVIRRARRAAFVSQTCLLLTGILALTVGFIGALHIVRHVRKHAIHT